MERECMCHMEREWNHSPLVSSALIMNTWSLSSTKSRPHFGSRPTLALFSNIGKNQDLNASLVMMHTCNGCCSFLTMLSSLIVTPFGDLLQMLIMVTPRDIGQFFAGTIGNRGHGQFFNGTTTNLSIRIKLMLHSVNAQLFTCLWNEILRVAFFIVVMQMTREVKLHFLIAQTQT